MKKNGKKTDQISAFVEARTRSYGSINDVESEQIIAIPISDMQVKYDRLCSFLQQYFNYCDDKMSQFISDQVPYTSNAHHHNTAASSNYDLEL
ncbi:hypothetical protein WN944_024061 [Citrus x changshan-huyou]|uniref:Uncharacterized protein n=1 Tax=Citrus x changshan-huyou TaxID=2935761 RepID=A0AAP0LRR2_9ROSI